MLCVLLHFSDEEMDHVFQRVGETIDATVFGPERTCPIDAIDLGLAGLGSLTELRKPVRDAHRLQAQLVLAERPLPQIHAFLHR
jgi:hypothetical protein